MTFLIDVSFVMVLVSIFDHFAVLSMPHTTNIRVIAMVIGNKNINLGYEVMGSAYDIALERAKELYPQVFTNFHRTNYFVPGEFSCAASDAEVTVGLGNLFRDNLTQKAIESQFRVVLAPGCSFEIITLGDFGREEDITILASTASIQVLSNKKRFPTTLALATTSYSNVGQATVQFLGMHSWTSATIICEQFRINSQNVAVEVLFGNVMRSFQAAGSFNIFNSYLDASQNTSFEQVLLECKSQSTILVVISFAPTFKSLLAKASELRMATGEYVFISLPLSGTAEFDNVWLQANPEISNFIATLPFAFFFVFGNVNWNRVQSQMKEMVNRSEEVYNLPLPPDSQFSDRMLGAYESVLMMSEILNETYNDLPRLSGRAFSAKFFNRTFDLPARPVSVSSTGMRICDVFVKQFNQDSSHFEALLVFESNQNKLKKLNGSQFRWSGVPFPPPVIPKCGFRNDRCLKQSKTEWIIILVLAGIIVVTAAACFFFWKKISVRKVAWLDLASINLDYMEDFRHALGNYRCPVRHTGKNALRLTVVAINGSPATTIEFSTIFARQKDLLNQKAIVRLLMTIKELDHPNISRLFGLLWTSSHSPLHQNVTFVYEYGPKGTLRSVIDNENFSLNWDLRYALIWDIAQGLHYIHSSPLRCHGSLNSFNCTITQSFTAKIGEAGFLKVMKNITNTRKTDLMEDPLWLLLQLWMAPETASDSLSSHTPSGDTYSFGVILFEIATRQPPFGIILDPQSSLYEITSTLKRQSSEPPLLKTGDTSPALVSLMCACLSSEPANRPTIFGINNILRRLYPHRSGKLIDRLIKRLEKYSVELEIIVADRTSTFLDEKQRVDLLLSELMPGPIILKLRNSEKTVPEFFDCVSVLFSDIPIFSTVVEKINPFTVVGVLQDLYSAIDLVIEEYDVYKVETVGDSYMVASGVPERNENKHASELAQLALTILIVTNSISVFENRLFITNLEARIGINSGSCVAGIVGLRLPRYCLFGDTVNTASRMETTGAASRIQISVDSRMLLAESSQFEITERGLINIKGKGHVETFWLSANKNPAK